MTYGELAQRLHQVWEKVYYGPPERFRTKAPASDFAVQDLLELAAELAGGDSGVLVARLVRILQERYPCTCGPYRKPGVFGRHFTCCPWYQLGDVLLELQELAGISDEVFDVELNYQKRRLG